MSAARMSVKTETSILENDQGKIYFPINRVKISENLFNFTYDYYADGDDICGLAFPKILAKIIDSTMNIGSILIKLGDGDRKDIFTLDAWISKQFPKLYLSLEAGRMMGLETKPDDYIISQIGIKYFTLKGGVLTEGSIGNSSSAKYYGWLAFHANHFYTSIGNEDVRNWLTVGIKGFKNMGIYSYAKYNRKSEDYCFSSIVAIKEINQKFFSQENFQFASNYFNLPAFFFTHFSPVSTKGEYSLRFDHSKKEKVVEERIIIGKQFGNIIQIALGANGKRENKKWHLAPVIEMYKPISFKEIKINIEAKYNFLNEELNIYLTTQFPF